jgi:hypothetical protein
VKTCGSTRWRNAASYGFRAGAGEIA